MKPLKLPLRGRIYKLKDRPGHTIKYYEGKSRKERRVPEDIPEHMVFQYAYEYLTAREAELRQGRTISFTDSSVGPVPTFKVFASRWTSGQLHEEFPDHVALKKSAHDDELRLGKHVYPLIGDIPITEFIGERGLLLAEDVMRQLPACLSQPSRRQVAQLMRRTLKLAAYPARLIPASPLPDGFVPTSRYKKAVAFLYPDEDAALLALVQVPVHLRVLYGFLAREGMRLSEAINLDWLCLDLRKGVVRVDLNKTDDARSWSLRPDVLKALRRWAILSGTRVGPVFHEVGSTKPIPVKRLARLLRHYLQQAGVTRPELFVASNNRIRLRVHDLRATFVTLSLANDKSETWVMDRTGHQSSYMLHRYRRAVDLARELALGELVPMHEIIPELAAVTIDNEDEQPSATTPEQAL